MLRLVLLVLYLAASVSAHTKSGGGWDPDGLSAPTPPPSTVDIGGGLDPNGSR
jgi:hypothetical protein